MITVKEAQRVRIKNTPLPIKYANFFETLPQNTQWTMGVAGKPGAGKSSMLLDFSGILSRFDKVLYANFEENVEGGTIQQKVKAMHVLTKYPWAKNRLVFLNSTDINDLHSYLKTGKYKYLVIDSVNKLKSRGSIKTNEILAIKDQYPKVSQIYVYHYRKDGKGYKGESDFEHEHDFFVEVQKGGTATFIKNRFKTTKTLKFDKLQIFN